MSHTSKIFEEAPIKVQNRNGFDLSHLNCGTSKTGQLVPVMCKLLPPNSKFTLGVNMEVNLPPLATPFYGKVDAIAEGFVVPCSILYGGWKQFISNQQFSMFPSSQDSVVNAGGYAIPYFDYGTVAGSSGDGIADFSALMSSNDNIYEYLGLRDFSRPVPGVPFPALNISMLPGLAYALVWDTWYRNKNVTKTIFAVNPNVGHFDFSSATPNWSVIASKNVSLVWHSFYTLNRFSEEAPAGGGALSLQSTGANFSVAEGNNTPSMQLTFPDGISFFSTRQRNYSRDYFTAAMLDPQQGNPSSLRFNIAGTADSQGDVTGNGEFTIASLRAANALQKFLETNGLSGDYAETMRNRWGVKPIDADFDEPYYLGRVVVPVYQHSIAQSSALYNVTDGTVEGAGNNVFTSNGLVGARAGVAGFKGQGSITDSFVNTTWSYVMVIFSLVPHANYGAGINRELTLTQIGDFPAPELQTIGHEAIKREELYLSASTVGGDFAYIPRFSFFKYMLDEVHGELRLGQTLDKFVLQRRDLATENVLTTSFLEIPQNALDDVLAVSTDFAQMTCWYEIFFEFKVSMPLADFCIPTLGELGDTHTIHAPIGGSRL